VKRRTFPGGDGQVDRPQPGDQLEVHVVCHRQAVEGLTGEQERAIAADLTEVTVSTRAALANLGG
jgi:hypothetical protein